MAGPPRHGASAADDSRPLVPGELRGYRQFELRDDGLYPLVHASDGPWSGQVEHARCHAGADHAPPGAGCRCGLYAWYLPGAATVPLGPVSAVIAARGRCVLGDRGFRAAAARVVAVSLPAGARLVPGGAARVRRMLAERYPEVAVYRSARRMLRDLPPQDVSGLGITPPPDRSRGYRAALVAVWAVVVALAYSLMALPGDTVASAVQRGWPLLVVGAVAWQVALVWLVVRLMALQGSPGAGMAAGGVGEGQGWKEEDVG